MRTLCSDLVASRKVVSERKMSNCAVVYILVADALEIHKHSEADALSKGVIGVPQFPICFFIFGHSWNKRTSIIWERRLVKNEWSVRMNQAL